MSTITIATRGSALALWQANHIKSLIEQNNPGIEVLLNIIKTTGDKILDVPLAKIGGKGLFVKEIETALLANEADLAVHSMKDVPVELPAELEIYANPSPEKPNDAFLSIKYNSINELPDGAVVGTSSLRRKLQLKAIKPNIRTEELRGNVNTRIQKMVDGQYDAIILAQAGLERLELVEHIKQTIPVDLMLPAVCQGVLGIEIRKGDTRTMEIIKCLKDLESEKRVAAERAFLTKLEGGCQAPIACHAVISGDKLSMTGYLSDLEGETVIMKRREGASIDAATVGRMLAEDILADGGDKILKAIYI
ncbi:MAG: hydroxymethylbilane synthase [Deferribacteraceae bacterium]|jgi:hydroxymethylbilane synthase|nr:hydroxymethylbilane synthase [Deferribacteraceae bacterium]